MDGEKQSRETEQEVPSKDTRPVFDPDDILQLLYELLERTEAMEARLEGVLESVKTVTGSNGVGTETEDAMNSSS